MTDKILTIEIGGKTRELLLPAERILDAALSPDGFDLAVLTDESVFVLDALDGDPPPILVSARCMQKVLPGFGRITHIFYDADGALFVADENDGQRKVDTRAAFLWMAVEKECAGDTLEEKFCGQAYAGETLFPLRCAVSDVVWKANRESYDICEEHWEAFVLALAQFNEADACAALRGGWSSECRYETYQNAHAHDSKFLKQLCLRVQKDIAYAVPFCAVGFAVNRTKTYVAPAAWVTFRDEKQKAYSLWVVPHLSDGCEKLRGVFRFSSMELYEEKVCWAEYDFTRPDFAGCQDSWDKDPYCQKPLIHHMWTFTPAFSQVHYALGGLNEPQQLSGTVPYGDFRLAVFYGLAGAE